MQSWNFSLFLRKVGNHRGYPTISNNKQEKKVERDFQKRTKIIVQKNVQNESLENGPDPKSGLLP
jgi:hypothetical protein